MKPQVKNACEWSTERRSTRGNKRSAPKREHESGARNNPFRERVDIAAKPCRHGRKREEIRARRGGKLTTRNVRAQALSFWCYNRNGGCRGPRLQLSKPCRTVSPSHAGLAMNADPPFAMGYAGAWQGEEFFRDESAGAAKLQDDNKREPGSISSHLGGALSLPEKESQRRHL